MTEEGKGSASSLSRKKFTVSQAQGMSPKAEKALAKWPRLKAERVTLLPFSPVPRPPTIREELHGLRAFFYGGPLMALVRGQQVYVVDDVRRKLLECSLSGEVLRELELPKVASKYLSGVLSLCGDWLWVGFEGPYAFAVDLNRWQIVEERRWEGGGIVSGLFAMPDKTLYVVMPGKRAKPHNVVWKLIKISAGGNQQEQMLEGWRPCYVTSDGIVYWVSDEPEVSKIFRLGYTKFGSPVKIIAEIHAEDLGAVSIDHTFGDSVVGLANGLVLCCLSVRIRISEQGNMVNTNLFVAISNNGQVRLVGLRPLATMPVRSVHLLRWLICERQLYFIDREDVGEYSRFWLMRAKLWH